MFQLFQTLVSICLFKAKPQDIPARFNYFFAVLISILILAWLGANIHTGHIHSLQKSLLYPLSYAVMLWVLLLLFNKSARWLQSVTALLGCLSIINTVVYILLYVLNVEINAIDLSSPPMFILVANFWFFIITAYILKETLEVKWFLATVLTFSSEIAASLILLKLLG